MKKIFVLLTLLTTTFVCAQDTVQDDVITEENSLACDCVDHEEKEGTEEVVAGQATLASVDEEGKEIETEATVSILACGSSSCTHGDKDNK